ncbi:MAG TPA: hypothetical protein VI011_09590 [Asanoa sp.]
MAHDDNGRLFRSARAVPRVSSAAAMVKTTPSGRGSRLLRVEESNPVYERLVHEVGGGTAGDEPSASGWPGNADFRGG